MKIELCGVGGYNESGRNCTAVKVGDEVVLFDLGLNLEPYIKYTEDEDVVKGIGRPGFLQDRPWRIPHV